MITATNSITDSIARLVRDRANQFFGRYTDEALVDYIVFHIQQGTLAFTGDQRRATGVMVGWGQDEPEPQPFAWQPHKPGGRFWYWHIFTATNAKAALMLADHFFMRHPECLARECLLERHGRTRRLPPGAALRIYQKGLRYGH